MQQDILSKLSPNCVFKHFLNLCAIPHGSGNEKGVSDYCVDFAKKNGLDFIQDEANNVIIFKSASSDKKDSEPIILQGHLDMVCAVADGLDIDMSVEPIKVQLDGDYIRAEGTSLGADNGIAVAMMLAILEDTTLSHPAIEAVFTTDEEVGMFGANAIDLTCLKGRRLINLDSEEEGVFTVGCAGGVRVYTTLPVTRERTVGTPLRLTVSGLAGGHSGAEIHLGRKNAVILLSKLTEELAGEFDIRIIEITGGIKDNVIPSYAVADILVLDECDPDIKKLKSKLGRRLSLLTEGKEKNAAVELNVGEAALFDALDKASTERITGLLSNSPFGVYKMSEDIEGLVETSDNLGTVVTEQNEILVDYSVRSSVMRERDCLANKICELTESYGGVAQKTAPYPAWEFRKESPLREKMLECWQKVSGKKGTVSVIHAGLECGLLGEKIKGLDAVSIGPEMHDIHSCNERLGISSTLRLWNYLLFLLENL